MTVRSGGTRALAAVLASALVFGGGCSGGDGLDLGPPGTPLTVTFGAIDTTTYASVGVVCIPFTITGLPSTIVDLIAQYLLQGSTSAASATPAPAGPGGVPPSSALIGLVLGPGGSLSGTFYWQAGADLGFLPGNVQFCLLPTANGVVQPVACSQVFTYDAGQSSQGSSGPGAGSGSGGNPPGGVGRALASAANVRPTIAPGSVKDLLLAGGYNNATPPNAFDSGDRFDFLGGGLVHTIPFSAATFARRVLHGSSFFLDPATGHIKVLVTGGVTSYDPLGASLAARVMGASATASAAVYCFSPTEQIVATMTMANPRYGHTATWVPSNQVVILGGASSTGAPTALSGTASIEHFDAVLNGFMAGPASAQMILPRVEHTATLLCDGRILVVGGYDPSSPATGLMSEVYNPVTGASNPVPAPPLPLRGHTATRLANGWVLVVGGRRTDTNALSNQAYVYRPEAGSPVGVFDPPITMDRARALHSATLLGDRSVVVAGGITSDVSNPGEQFTTSTQVFRVPDCFSPGAPLAFSPVNPLTEPRAEHAAATVDCGSLFIVGGRNNAGMAPNLNFLDSIEFYAFSNAVPAVSSAMTSAGSPAGHVAIRFTVTDADQDGGYVVIRFRDPAGGGAWRHATLVSQVPSSLPGNFPNCEVCPGNYTFVWNFQADGVSSGSTVDIQVIPFGAVLGSPVQFLAVTP